MLTTGEQKLLVWFWNKIKRYMRNSNIEPTEYQFGIDSLLRSRIYKKKGKSTKIYAVLRKLEKCGLVKSSPMNLPIYPPGWSKYRIRKFLKTDVIESHKKRPLIGIIDGDKKRPPPPIRIIGGDKKRITYALTKDGINLAKMLSKIERSKTL